ncbi:MAG TPA: TonB family protein [Kofleriaceae bacterium]|nr:TonB family protein [Kofleriaceae bacterium]
MPVADQSARGATYLARVALQLQPGWGQFLDDCRLRLPASHPLNQLGLAAHVELAVDATGKLVAVELASSGNADFDRAVREALTDAAPLPSPPAELRSDDDLVHLRWLFARDRRQAGPATAEVVMVEQPLVHVVHRLIIHHQLERAARRITKAPANAERTEAIDWLVFEVLDEAVAAHTRAAIDAIAAVSDHELESYIEALLADPADADLRRAAIAAAVRLHDTKAAPVLATQLADDLRAHSQLAVTDAEALVALGFASTARDAVAAVLAAPGEPDPIALEAAGRVTMPELAGRLAGWLAHGGPRTRAGVCAAASTLPDGARWIEVGLRDGDASVRARCAEAAGTARIASALPRLRELARDRDRVVRARAVTALARLDRTRLVHLADDPAPEVRAAYAAALAGDGPELRALADDRDADVRAAAWHGLAAAGVHDVAARVADDPSPDVRRAALPVLPTDVVHRLASGDDSPDVRGAALVEWARRRGRAEAESELLARIAAAPDGSPDRVAAALAWLLAS